MNRNRSVYLSMLALALSAGIARAGTKYQASLVPANSGTADTLSAASSKVQMTGKGSVQVKASKLTDSGSAAVTTAGTGADVQYVAIVSGVASGVGFHLDILVSAKNGTGSVKYDASGLTTASTGASIVITGVEFRKPVPAGPDVAACNAIVSAATLPGVVIDPAANPCADGALIANAGVVAGF